MVDFHEKKIRNLFIFSVLLIIAGFFSIGYDDIRVPIKMENIVQKHAWNKYMIPGLIVILYAYSVYRFWLEVRSNREWRDPFKSQIDRLIFHYLKPKYTEAGESPSRIEYKTPYYDMVQITYTYRTNEIKPPLVLDMYIKTNVFFKMWWWYRRSDRTNYHMDVAINAILILFVTSIWIARLFEWIIQRL